MKIIIEFVIQNIEYNKEIKSLKNTIIFYLRLMKNLKNYSDIKYIKKSLKNNFFMNL